MTLAYQKSGEVIPEKYKHLDSGKLFLQWNSGPEDSENRILGLCSEEDLQRSYSNDADSTGLHQFRHTALTSVLTQVLKQYFILFLSNIYTVLDSIFCTVYVQSVRYTFQIEC